MIVRRFIPVTANATRIAPTENPSMSAPQIRPTSTSEKPAFSTKAVASTGKLTMTVYPTNAMKMAMVTVCHLSNAFGAPFGLAMSLVIKFPSGALKSPAITN